MMDINTVHKGIVSGKANLPTSEKEHYPGMAYFCHPLLCHPPFLKIRSLNGLSGQH